MRPLYVSVRLAATVMAVAAAAGCMSVGDDGGGRAGPSHSAGQRGGEAPDGGTAATGGDFGFGAAGDGKHGHGKGKGKGKRGESAAPSDAPSAAVSGKGGPAKGRPGKTEKPGAPLPTAAPPSPTRTAAPTPTPTEQPPTASPEPTVAEPSSSAHEETAPQMVQREPAPEAGSPV